MTKIHIICNECGNDFLSKGKLNGKWYEKPQCGKILKNGKKCGSRNCKEMKKF